MIVRCVSTLQAYWLFPSFELWKTIAARPAKPYEVPGTGINSRMQRHEHEKIMTPCPHDMMASTTAIVFLALRRTTTLRDIRLLL